MPNPNFSVEPLNKGSFAINDHGRTVALISRFGDIDWLLKTTLEDGLLVATVRKESHLCHTLGMMMRLYCPSPGTLTQRFSTAVEAAGTRVVIRARAVSADGRFTSETVAELHTDEAGVRYEWDFETTFTNVSAAPVDISCVEFNNVYPSKAYLGATTLDTKMYSKTLVVDKDGVVWNFPHQHTMHMGPKMSDVKFGVTSVAGFFGDRGASPVVEVTGSSVPLAWGICDMFYDLHCSALPDSAMMPGSSLRFEYTVKYLNAAESAALEARERPMPVSDNDRQAYDIPRLDLGMNHFNQSVHVDRPDEALCFRTRPPVRVWDRQVGHSTLGSLRITNETAQETVWAAEPPSRIPAAVKLNVTAMIKTEGVEGRGATVRIREHTWEFEPTPHVEYTQTVESEPVTGTSNGWVRVTVPELHVTGDKFDYLVYVDVVLDGKGRAWITDMDINLQPAPEAAPSWEEGSLKKALREVTPARTAVGAGAAA